MGTNPKFMFFILFFAVIMAKLCLCANSTFGCIQRERQALLSFKESFDFEYQPNILSSWEGRNCCQWKGVGCDASSGHVVKLDLRWNPQQFGHMKSLESVDFSFNKLSGKIPRSMSALLWLSYLNLSHNNFSGMIPKENQFQSLNDPSSYGDNPYLCGAPLPNECSTGIKARDSRGNEDQHSDGKGDKYERLLFYLVIAIGFATGFWGFIGVLLIKKSWRHSYFRFVENIADKMYVAAVVRAAKLERWMQRNHNDE